METTKRIRDVEQRDLAALERVFGQALDSQSDAVVVLKTVDRTIPSRHAVEGGKLPSWCNVYEGLSAAEIDEIESGIERLDLTRPRS